MGKMKDALVRLAKKVTGTDVENKDSISGVIDYMAENYEGGGGGSYTAGENITIENDVISATDTKYTAGEGISISEQNVISATGGSASLGLQFQPTDKVLRPFVEYTLNASESGTGDVDSVRLDTAKLKQALINANYDLDVAITIPQEAGEDYSSMVLDIVFTLNLPSTDGYNYIRQLSTHMYFILIKVASDIRMEIRDSRYSSISELMQVDITGFSGNTLEDLLDYMITNNINLVLACTDEAYDTFMGWMSWILNGCAEGSLIWYATSTFSNIAIIDLDNAYNPDIFYIDSADIEDALIIYTTENN